MWGSIKQKSREYNAKKMKAGRTGNDKGDFAENFFFEKVLEVTGTSHGNGLPLLPEGGFGKEKRSQNNIVVYGPHRKKRIPPKILQYGKLKLHKQGVQILKNPQKVFVCA